MTINSTFYQPKKVYVGDGTSTGFAVNSWDGTDLTGVIVYKASDIVVNTIAPGGTPVIVPPANYSVTFDPSPANMQGKLINCRVVFVAAPTLGTTIVITRNMRYEQGLLLTNANVIPPKTLEYTLDNIVSQITQIDERLALTVRVDPSKTIATTIAPLVATNNTYLGWDSSGNIVNKTPTDIGISIGNTTVSQVANILSGATTFYGNKTFTDNVSVGGTFAASGAANFSSTITMPVLGLGVSAITAINNINTINNSGNYVALATATGVPNTSEMYVVQHFSGTASTSAIQIAIGLTSGLIYTRAEIGGVWGAYRHIHNMGDELRGVAPQWATATTITMGATQCMDSTRTTYINATGATLNFGTTGLNGLDTGTLAANTGYYIWVILNPTTGATGFLASLSRTAPAMPSGFTIRRLLPLWVRTKLASAAIMAFQVVNWGLYPFVYFLDAFLAGASRTPLANDDDTRVLNNGAATTYTSVSCAAFMPAFSREARLHVGGNWAANGLGAIYIRGFRSTTTTAEGKELLNTNTAGITYDLFLTATQTFDYRVATTVSGATIAVEGYRVTEVVG